MAHVIGGLGNALLCAKTTNVSYAIQVQATASSADKTTHMEMIVNTIATLDV